MKVTAIQIVTGRGMDKVSLETDLRGPFPGEKLSFDFMTPKGDAVGYVASTFPDSNIKFEVIDVSRGPILAYRMGEDAVVCPPDEGGRRPLAGHRTLPGSQLPGSLGLATQLHQEGRDAQAPEQSPAIGPSCNHTRLLDQPHQMGKRCVDCNDFFPYRELRRNGPST